MPFDNTKGFVPHGSLLYYWTLLPQSSTTLAGKRIPSLFGKLKGIGFYYTFVIGLIIAEFYLIFFALPKDGVPTVTLLIFSLLDFAIGIIPLFFETKPDWNLSILKAEKYIAETNLNPKTLKYDSNETTLSAEEKSLASTKRQIIYVYCIKILISAAIMAFAWVKFITYVRFYGGVNSFIYDTIGSGRLLFYVIIGGALVHIFFTKTFIYHIIYWVKFKIQKNEFRISHKTDFDINQKNKDKLFEYNVDVHPKEAFNQKIWQRVEDTVTGPNIISLTCSKVERKFRTDKIILAEKNVYLVVSGLLLDTEINSLFSQQPDNDIARAVIATCKKQQIFQVGLK